MAHPTVATILADALLLSDKDFNILVGALSGIAISKGMAIPQSAPTTSGTGSSGRGRGTSNNTRGGGGRGRGRGIAHALPLFGSNTNQIIPTPSLAQTQPPPTISLNVNPDVPSPQGTMSPARGKGVKRSRAVAQKSNLPEIAWRSRWGQLARLEESWGSSSESIKGTLCGSDRARLHALIVLHKNSFDHIWGDPPRISEAIKSVVEGVGASPTRDSILAEAQEFLRNQQAQHLANIARRDENRLNRNMNAD